MLEVRELSAWYKQTRVLRDVSFSVPAGEVVAITGPNGAGKTTLARCIAGMHSNKQGTVVVSSTDISACDAVDAARAGIALVPQGRRLFGSLTVAEHFKLARVGGIRHPLIDAEELATSVFPRLSERMSVRANFLSGGEQQMVAISRAVLQGPIIVIMDEPLEGVAPIIVARIRDVIRRLCDHGAAVVVMAQAPGSETITPEMYGHLFPYDIADVVLEIRRGTIESAS